MLRTLAGEFLVLRLATDRRVADEAVVAADPGRAMDAAMGADHRAGADFHIGTDQAEGAHLHIVGQACGRIDDGGRVDPGCVVSHSCLQWISPWRRRT
ncbi:hypothetical protein G6F65_021709 [Rhizopus arrhizus]|nr:hypothetical protein G6F65_021709 [Rhizopus arrhizus]